MKNITKDELKKDLDDGLQIYDIVKKYDISIWTIRRYIKKCGFKLPRYIQTSETKKLRVDAIKRAEEKNPGLKLRKINKLLSITKERKGKTNIQFYGEEKAKIIKERSRISHIGIPCREETKKKIKNGNIGKTHTDVTKRMLSESRLNGFANGTIKLSYNVGVGKGGFKEDIGHYIRSSYEHFFAKLLKLCKINYEYEPKTFNIIVDFKKHTFTPDFLINGVWFEIKNSYNVNDIFFNKKLEAFKTQYINEKVNIIVGNKNWNVNNLNKDIDTVMMEQKDLVDIVVKLQPLAVIKG